MSDTPLIRSATAEDVARIAAIARAAYAKYVPRIGREPAPMGADYGAEIAARHAMVIEIDERICGFMIAWAEADAYVVDNVAVEPDRQGEGLGRRLMEHAAVEARRLKLPALRLYTNEAMTENLSMYARLGFVETHRGIERGFHRIHLRRSLAENER